MTAIAARHASDTPPSPEAPTIISLDHVSKVFNDGGANRYAALVDVSLGIAPRSCTLIEGPSGSGKSTLLSLLGCMVRPTSGRVRFGDLDVTRLHEDELCELRRRIFGFVFQANQLIRGLSALDNVMVPALPCPERNGDLVPQAWRLLAFFGLAARAEERAERLSGGEQQRVALARALINDPSIILADEPTACQDSCGVRRFLDYAESLLARGKTLVIASHDPVLCGSGIFSARMALRRGRQVAAGRRSWY